MNRATIFVLLIILSGCSLQKFCNGRYPCSPVVRDSVNTITEVVFRDTTIFVQVPGRIVTDTVFIDSTNEARSLLSSSFAQSLAVYENGRLYHTLTQKDSTIAALIAKAIRLSSTTQYESKTERVEIVRNELTGWQHTQIYAAWILAIILAGTWLWNKIPGALIGKLMGLFKKKQPP